MKGNSRYDNDKFSRKPVNGSRIDSDYDRQLTSVNSGLFLEISEYMQAVLDVEDVKSDPAYSSAADAAATTISRYRENNEGNPEIEKFIRESLSKLAMDRRLRDEINQIKNEIDRNNLDEISSELIKDWLIKRDKSNGKDPKTEEIREFITGSLNREEPVSWKISENKRRRILSKSLIIRYSSLAAAIVVGAIFLIKSLLPAGDTQKLFNKYYEPFNAVSSVTRGTVTDGNIAFNRAVENYKSGNFKAAETGFSESMVSEPTFLQAHFFLGITEIELKNPSKATELLGEVANRKGDYAKEATWYLGLAYIKTGDKIRASKCFELLAKSPGFYSDRSQKILRYLR
jgi:TolA-binding protein